MPGQRLKELERFDGALTHAVLCYEEFPFVRPDLVQWAEARYPQLAGWIALDRRRAICEALQTHRAGPEANARRCEATFRRCSSPASWIR